MAENPTFMKNIFELKDFSEVKAKMESLGLGCSSWLEDRNYNITKQLFHIIKAFSDFRLVAQIRGEIDQVKLSDC